LKKLHFHPSGLLEAVSFLSRYKATGELNIIWTKKQTRNKNDNFKPNTVVDPISHVVIEAVRAVIYESVTME